MICRVSMVLRMITSPIDSDFLLLDFPWAPQKLPSWEVFLMANNLVFRWPTPLFFMVWGGSWLCYVQRHPHMAQSVQHPKLNPDSCIDASYVLQGGPLLVSPTYIYRRGLPFFYIMIICSLKIYPSHHQGVKHETMTVYDLNLKSPDTFLSESFWITRIRLEKNGRFRIIPKQHHGWHLGTTPHPDVNKPPQATHADLFPSTAGTYANVNSVEATVISCGWKEGQKSGFSKLRPCL